MDVARASNFWVGMAMGGAVGAALAELRKLL
jgi:hypothetical protein